MERVRRLTAIIEREDDMYVALCPEYDIASQGSTIEESRANLIEALTLFFETAGDDEIERRGRSGVFESLRHLNSLHERIVKARGSSDFARAPWSR